MVIILVAIAALVVLSAMDRDRWSESEEGSRKRSPGAKRLPPRRRTRRSTSVLSFQDARKDHSSSSRWWWE